MRLASLILMMFERGFQTWAEDVGGALAYEVPCRYGRRGRVD